MRKTGGGLEDDDDAGGRRTGDYRSADAGWKPWICLARVRRSRMIRQAKVFG